MATVIGRIQRFEANQRTRRFAHIRCLHCGKPGQPEMGCLAQTRHVQTERRIAGQLDRRMAETHVARDRQPAERLGQPRAIQAIGGKQWQRVDSALGQRLRQAVHEADRQIAQAHRLMFHGRSGSQ